MNPNPFVHPVEVDKSIFGFRALHMFYEHQSIRRLVPIDSKSILDFFGVEDFKFKLLH